MALVSVPPEAMPAVTAWLAEHDLRRARMHRDGRYVLSINNGDLDALWGHLGDLADQVKLIAHKSIDVRFCLTVDADCTAHDLAAQIAATIGGLVSDAHYAYLHHDRWAEQVHSLDDWSTSE